MNTIRCIKISLNNKLLAAGGNKLKIWKFSNGKLVKSISSHNRTISNIEFSQNSKFLLSCSFDERIIMLHA